MAVSPTPRRGVPAEEVWIVTEHGIDETRYCFYGFLEALWHGGKARAVEECPPLPLSGSGERVEGMGQRYEPRTPVGGRPFEGLS